MLSPGVRLGPYEIVGSLGAGGMGEVYKAADTRLDRIVAIKVLPEHVAADPELRQRFEREAKTLAALSHPHICHIHDVGRQVPSTPSTSSGQAGSGEAVDFLVMEYLEGETLAQRLAKGALPVDQALQVAIQIAESLDKAHRKGIVHRDLKPGNIMLTKSGVGSAGSLQAKLLDFGLAKLWPTTVAGGVVPGEAPTVSSPITGAGTILGTFQYMAPEQLEGQEADARTDIFAFGAVVYEMVTGKKAFEGKSQASLIAAILEREPPALASLQPLAPPSLERLVAKCLLKDPNERWQTAKDLYDELRWIAQASSTGAASSSANARTGWGSRRWLVGAVAALVVLTAGGALGRFLGRSTETALSPVRLSFARPPGTTITNTGRRSIDISPDGTRVVFVANQRLYLRRLDGAQAEPIAGTESVNIHSPVFSPDGQWVAFQQEGLLKRIPVGGGVPTTVFQAQMNWGGSWDDTGNQIVFANDEGVFRVSGSGGAPEKVYSAAAGETIYGPRMLPGGDHILLTITTATGPDRWDRAQIVAQSVGSGERTVLVEGGSDARYVPTGHLVYAIGTSLFAVSFDARALRVTGAPVAIEQGIRRASTPGANTAAANFAISRDGTLVFLPDATLARGTMAFADLKGGAVEPLSISGEIADGPRVSPSGTEVAVLNRQDNAIWIHSLRGDASPRRLTLEGADPIWSPDSSWIAFYSARTAARGLYQQRADGSAAPELLTPVTRGAPVSWSRNGLDLFYLSEGRLWSVRPGTPPRAILDGIGGYFDVGASLSPDGKWVAFHVVERGITVPYIQSMSGTGGKYTIASTGSYPLWAPDGRRLFFVADDSRRLMVVDVTLQPSVVFGQPVVALDAIVQRQSNDRNFDVMPDGTRLLVLVPDAESNSESPLVEVVQHWTERLRRLVQVD